MTRSREEGCDFTVADLNLRDDAPDVVLAKRGFEPRRHEALAQRLLNCNLYAVRANPAEVAARFRIAAIG